MKDGEPIIAIAPTFQPTAEEFQDPYKYIRSISKVGSEFGIVKIIPPSDFKPSLNLLAQGETFSFKTRNQTIAHLDGQTRLQLCYSQQLYKFHQSAKKVYKVPEINGKHVNMYKLSKLIDHTKTDEPLLSTVFWKEVARQLGYPESSHKNLRNIWKEWILPFDQYIALEPKPSTISSKDQVMKPAKSQKLANIFSIAESEYITDDIKKVEAEFRIFCQKRKSNLNQKLSSIKYLMFFEDFKPPYHGPWNKRSSLLSARAPFKKDTSAIDYDYDSEAEWQSNHLAPETDTESDFYEDSSDDDFDGNNNINFGEKPNSRRKRERAPKAENSTEGSRNNKKVKKSQNLAADGFLDPKEFFPIGTELCVTCSEPSSNSHRIVICDDCENAYHLNCVTPSLTEYPHFSWICRQCIVDTGKFKGFKDNEEPRILNEFKKRADLFKEDYLKNEGLSESEIETEFWKLTESPFEDLVVEYGADLHTSIHGSGFPTSNDNPYSFHPWNLNNLPVRKDSLFKMIKNDISGMMIPWIYVGMMFSAFCWHVEDHYAYSINYLHTGDSKIWYGIPSASADNFEACMRKFNGELFKDDPDLLLHLTTIISPKLLMRNNTFVCTTKQNAGEFIITFPRAYHAGFNTGFNIAEAVNFAPADWIPFGSDSIELYSLYKRPPVFSHEELLVRTILALDFSPEMFLYLKEAFGTLIQKEMKKRACITATSLKTILLTENLSEENQCVFCKRFCLLSTITCETCNQYSCLDHSDQISCKCSTRSFALYIFYSDDYLQELYDIILQAAQLPENWSFDTSEGCRHYQNGLSMGFNSFPSLNLQDRNRSIEMLLLKMKTIQKNVSEKHSLQELEKVLNELEPNCHIPEVDMIKRWCQSAQHLNDDSLRNLESLAQWEEISSELEKLRSNLLARKLLDKKLSLLEKYKVYNIGTSRSSTAIEEEKSRKWKEDVLNLLGSKGDFSLNARFFRQCFLLASQNSTYDSHCICRSNNPDVCIQCVSCKYLYHLVCLKIQSPVAPFYCPCCRITKGYNPHRKPGIKQLIDLLDYSKNLRILPGEAVDLLNTSKELIKWLDKVGQTIKCLKDPIDLRNWLRRLYGLPVVTAEAEEIELYLS